MADNNRITAVIRGETSYFKMLPDQLTLNYSKDGKEWSTDIVLSKEAVADLKSYGVSSKIKKKDEYLNGKPYIRFTQKEFNSKGEKNPPVDIVDIVGAPWDPNAKIGNGSVVDIRFQVVDYGAQKGLYIRKVRVLEHVPFEGGGKNEFEPVSEDDEYFAKFAEAEAKKAAELSQFKADFNLADEDLDDPVD